MKSVLTVLLMSVALFLLVGCGDYEKPNKDWQKTATVDGYPLDKFLFENHVKLDCDVFSKTWKVKSRNEDGDGFVWKVLDPKGNEISCK